MNFRTGKSGGKTGFWGGKGGTRSFVEFPNRDLDFCKKSNRDLVFSWIGQKWIQTGTALFSVLRVLSLCRVPQHWGVDPTVPWDTWPNTGAGLGHHFKGAGWAWLPSWGAAGGPPHGIPEVPRWYFWAPTLAMNMASPPIGNPLKSQWPLQPCSADDTLLPPIPLSPTFIDWCDPNQPGN